MNTLNPAIKLVDHFGGIRQAAEHFEISYESMRRWFNNGIPVENALDAEIKSSGIIRGEEILQFWRDRITKEAAASPAPQPAEATQETINV